MKPVIRQINDAENQGKLAKLNSFNEKILGNSMLSAKQKADAIKVVNNIKYIKLNIEYIGYCAEHKNDPSIYKYPSDKGKGVLRDQDNTSFHINSYNEKSKAVRDHANAYLRFEDAIERLEKTSPLTFYTIVAAFYYDSPIGCINTRIEPFYATLDRVLTKGLLSFELAGIFYDLFVKRQADRTISVNNAVETFATDMQLSDEDKTKLREGLENSFYLDEKDFSGTLHNAFGSASAETIAQAADIEDHLAKSFTIIKGLAGMIQVWFDTDSQAEANSFVQYLHTQAHIPDINRANAQPQRNGAFIVRLTEEQARAFNNNRLNEVISQSVTAPIVPAFVSGRGRNGNGNNQNQQQAIDNNGSRPGGCTIQ